MASSTLDRGWASLPIDEEFWGNYVGLYSRSLFSASCSLEGMDVYLWKLGYAISNFFLFSSMVSIKGAVFFSFNFTLIGSGLL
jgi:hypothetical protein